MANINPELAAYGVEPDDDHKSGINPELAAHGVELDTDQKAALTNYVSGSKGEEGQLDAAILGAQDGMTFGFDDELSGATGAGFDKMMNALGLSPDQAQLETSAANLPAEAQESFRKENEIKPRSLEDMYKEYRDMRRADKKAAHDKFPATYFAGNMAGGFAVPMGGVAHLGKDASMLQKMAMGAKIGAPLGAIGAAGMSEAPVMSGEFAADVGLGAGLGGAIGGAAPAVLPAVKSVGSGLYGGTKGTLGWLSEKLLGPIPEAFEMGVEGTNAISKAGVNKVKNEVGQFANNVAPALQQQIEQLAIAKNKAIQEAQAAGMKIDPAKIEAMINARLGDDPQSNLPEVMREIEQFRELLRTAQSGAEVQKIERVFFGDGKTQKGKFFDLAQQKHLEQELVPGSMSHEPLETIIEPTDIPGKSIGIIRQKQFDADGNFIGYKKIASKLLDESEVASFKDIAVTERAGGKDLSNPEEMYRLYKDLKAKSTFGDHSFKTDEARKAAGETIGDVQSMLRETVPQLKGIDDNISGLKRAAEALGINDTTNINEKQVRDKIISMIGQDGKISVGNIKAQETINEFLGELEKVNPTMAASIREQFPKLGSRLSTLQEIHKPISLLSLASPLAITRTLGTGAANLTGLGAGKIANLAKTGVAEIERMTPDFLKASAMRIRGMGTPATEQLAEVLVRAADSNERTRNAIIFGVMQNPAYRKLLTEEDEQQPPAK